MIGSAVGDRRRLLHRHRSTGKIRQWFNVPTFITTLALFTALRGAANLITGGFPLATFPSWFEFFGGGYLLRHPVPGLRLRRDLRRACIS